MSNRQLEARAAHLRRLAKRARDNSLQEHARTLDQRAAELERTVKDNDAKAALTASRSRVPRPMA